MSDIVDDTITKTLYYNYTLMRIYGMSDIVEDTIKKTVLYTGASFG